MNRRDLRLLAELRVRDAESLLRARCSAGAYYLAGYAVECALKACIAKRTRRFEFPDKKRAGDAWVHDLTKLVGVAGLMNELTATARQSRAFGANWEVVKKWDEESRYRQPTRQDARELLRAISDADEGVLSWLRKHW